MFALSRRHIARQSWDLPGGEAATRIDAASEVQLEMVICD